MEKVNIREYLREREAEKARVLKGFALTEEDKILQEIENEETQYEVENMVKGW